MPYQRKRYGIEPDPSIQHPAGILVDERRQTGRGKHRATPPRTSPAKRISEAKATNEILATRRPTHLGGRTGISSSCTDRTEGSDGRRVISLYGNISHANIAIFRAPVRISLSRKIPARKARSRPAELRASFGTVQSFRSGTGSERKPATDSWKRLIFPRRNATAQAENRSNYRSDSQSRRPTQSLPGISPRNARPNRLPVNVVRALRGSESEARAGRSG